MNKRLAEPYGKWIDRSAPILFRFDDHVYSGYRGDMLSTALWANGIRILGRSFKHHRPRGIWSLADADANCLVENEFETNLRGDSTPLREALDVRAVNTLGGAAQDWLRYLERLSRITPVGFYYKAFHKPRCLFPLYERILRRFGGLGRVNPQTPRRHPPKEYAFCDVLVVGAGAAGLAAALAAAESGAQVMLVERNPHLGGSLQFRYAREEHAPGILKDLLARVTQSDKIDIRVSTAAVSLEPDRWIALIDEARLTKVRARAVIIAAGAYEQPAVFRNNDVPGVMLASAAQRLIHLYAVKPFDAGVVLTANSDGYRAALDLLDAGVQVRAIVDLRGEGESTALEEAAKDAGIDTVLGSCVYEVTPARGGIGVRQAIICPLDAVGVPHPDRARAISCDGVAMSVEWTPADELLRQSGARMVYEESVEQFVPRELPSGVFAAGKVNGVYGVDDQLRDGTCAGLEAAAFLGLSQGAEARRPGLCGPALSHPYPVIPHPKGKNYVDLDEDLQLKDIENAVQEGFDSVELLKRYATIGMGPSQGRHSNLNAMRILARLRGLPLTWFRLPTARPYVTPVPLSQFAGRCFIPRRRTSLHAWHEAHGAKFMHAGVWLRPGYYAVDARSRDACIAAEVAAVRTHAGLIDVGTLGKIEVYGKGAADFLERTYTGTFATLRPSKARYGVMCDETGVVIDDGVVARVEEDRYYLTTTTGASDAIFAEMQRNALVWALDVSIVNVTSTFCAMNVAGPKARRLLQPLTDVDLGAEAFPYMGFRQGTVAGVPARILRVGFVSDLGYELHVPADGARVVWEALMQAGAPDGLLPFGVDAQRALRLEKGHIIIGRDTDALTTPFEVGLDWALKQQKPYFVGQRSLRIISGRKPSRRLVGFVLPEEYSGPMPEDCHLVIQGQTIAGRVTSIFKSAAAGRVIGLAYVRPEQAEIGTEITIRGPGGKLIKAAVTTTPFVKDTPGA